MQRKPWVAVPADCKWVGPHPFQAVGEKYLRALHEAAGVQALIWPSLSDPQDHDTLLDRIDGLFLTGSHSNLEPQLYGAESVEPSALRDPQRDRSALALIPAALERNVPILAVCRGMQEVNVALGGSLLQQVQCMPGLNDHREDPAQPLEQQYAPAHQIKLSAGGLLAELAGGERAQVNSLHGQGIDRLGGELLVEARAEDGLIEAVRSARPDRFLLAVQWHPEWKATQNPFYRAIFNRFGEACRARAEQRA